MKKAVLNLTDDQFDRCNVLKKLLRTKPEGFAVGFGLGDAVAPKSLLQLAGRTGSEVRSV